MERILIRHLSGARAGQVDEFPAAETSEILVGRDPEATVRFDPSREDLVSRQHVKIVRDPESPNEFAAGRPAEPQRHLPQSPADLRPRATWPTTTSSNWVPPVPNSASSSTHRR